jgi:hypothetical protein
MRPVTVTTVTAAVPSPGVVVAWPACLHGPISPALVAPACPSRSCPPEPGVPIRPLRYLSNVKSSRSRDGKRLARTCARSRGRAGGHGGDQILHPVMVLPSGAGGRQVGIGVVSGTTVKVPVAGSSVYIRAASMSALVKLCDLDPAAGTFVVGPPGVDGVEGRMIHEVDVEFHSDVGARRHGFR